MRTERRAELLARADREALIELADRCASQEPAATVVVPAEVGSIVLEVREPVAHERFHLGEVLACRAEVIAGGAHGWAVRLGDDRLATLAAAVCDAEAEAGRPLAAEVEELCRRTADAMADELLLEWAELAPTEVVFEVMDR